MKILYSATKLLNSSLLNICQFRAVSRIVNEPNDFSYLDCFMTSLPEPAIQVVKEKPKIKVKRLVDKAKIKIAHKYKTHNLNDVPTTMELKESDAKVFYKRMLAMRKIHNLIKSNVAIADAKSERKVQNTNGHEASAVGLRAAMSYNDTLVSSKRYFGSVKELEMLAELTASVIRPRHLRWIRGGPKRHINQLVFFGVNGNTAAQVPVANGLAFARKLRNQPGAVVTLYGDEHINQGQLIETFDLAVKWNLPCVFVYENDGRGVASNLDFYKSAQNIPGICVNGAHFPTIYCAGKYAMQYAQKRGPVLLEVRHNFTEIEKCKHEEGEEADGEKSVTKSIDPLDDFSELCLENELLSKKDLNILAKNVDCDVSTIVEKLRKNPEVAKRMDFADSYFACIESKTLNDEYVHYHKQSPRSSYLCS